MRKLAAYDAIFSHISCSLCLELPDTRICCIKILNAYFLKRKFHFRFSLLLVICVEVYLYCDSVAGVTVISDLTGAGVTRVLQGNITIVPFNKTAVNVRFATIL